MLQALVCQRYFFKALAVMVTAKANASANGGMIQDGCKLAGNAKYCILEAIINGMAAFSVSTST